MAQDNDNEELSDDELAAILAAEVSSAVTYDNSELVQCRVRNIEYSQGEMNDVQSEAGRSEAVSMDVRDTIGWIMPQLMEIFAGSERTADFLPVERGDEDYAEQVSDYIQHVVWSDCDGYQVLHDAFYDCLLTHNGILKSYWDDTPETKVYEFSGLSEDQVVMLVRGNDVEVMAQSQSTVVIDGPEGQPIELPVYEIKIRKTISKGRIAIEAIPPEEFLISRDAKSLSDARFKGHRKTVTRSELIKDGYPKEQVDALPGHPMLDYEEERLARHSRTSTTGTNNETGFDNSTEEIEIIEGYLQADVNGDGIAETVRVLSGGNGGADILEWEEWDDDTVFADLVASRISHRFHGESVADLVADIQRIKTVLWRAILDNIYMTNQPEIAVIADQVLNPDALLERSIGNVIRLENKGVPANQAISTVDVPFTASQSIGVMEVADSLTQRRVGVSPSSQALDPDSLQNQTATAVNKLEDASSSKIKLIARNIAEMGLRRFFKNILKLTVKHQDRPRTFRLRNDWVDVDPRVWNAGMDVTVNIGLGTGSRERDLLALREVYDRQLQIVASLPPGHPYALKLMPSMRETLAKITAAAGLNSPEMYFPEWDQADTEAIQQAGQSDPEMEKEKAKLEMEVQRDQAKMQIEQQSQQTEAQLKREQIDAELGMKRYQIDKEMELKREQIAAELQLKREMAAVSAVQNAQTSDVHVGGEPG